MNIQEFNEYKRAALHRVFRNLNERQREAVFCVKGPLLILAGAGSGKTTVLINRICYLLRYGNAYADERLPQGITEEDMEFVRNFATAQQPDEQRLAKLIACDVPQPWCVMAITFTNKAAGELCDRLRTAVGPESDSICASTFHSACARFLRRDIDRLGMRRDFTIYDNDESRHVVKNLLKEFDFDAKMFSPKDVYGEISAAKNAFVLPEEYRANAGGDYRKKVIAEVYDGYQKFLFDNNALDFDDLLVQAVRLLKENPDVLQHYRERFRYILVDEYQDTNMVQYRLIAMLAGEHLNLCVVGDDDQSIYGFRGATIENILSFEDTFPNATVIRLEQNYRSTGNILDAANAVIAKNRSRKGKTLWTDRGRGDKVTQHFCADERAESEYIATTIRKAVDGGAKYSDHAILYRINAVSATLERSLVSRKIPYRVFGGQRFYDRKEIKDMVAYLSVIANDGDTVRLSRIINEPKRGIGDGTVAAVQTIAEEQGISMLSVMAQADSYAALSGRVKQLTAFAQMIIQLRESLENGESLASVYTRLLDVSGYMTMLEVGGVSEQVRIENVSELLSEIKKYEKESDGGDLEGFLEDCALMTDFDNYDRDADAVVLMTVHGAKGLEFNTVFVAACEENVFPSSLSLYSQTQIEEERRLAYVAFTRAKRRLYITHTGSRMLYGATMRNRLSRFAEDIPAEFKDVVAPTQSYAQTTFTFAGGYTGDRSRTAPQAAPRYAGAVPSQKPAPTVAYTVGMTVIHPTFGRGMITCCTKMGGDSLLEIAFDGCGTKRLMANFARLKTE